MLTDEPRVRAANAMPPLLQRLTERKPETLDYLGVSYGLTPQLLRYVPDLFERLGRHSPSNPHRFWKRAGYVPLYLRQTQSELTGEHTCVMLRGLNSSTESELEWLSEFAKGACAGFSPPHGFNLGWTPQISDAASSRFSPTSSASSAA